MRKKPKPPRGCFWRGNVLWGRMRASGKDYRWSLHTTDDKTALLRRAAKVVPADSKTIKARIANNGLLSPDEMDFVFEAIDALIIRRRLAKHWLQRIANQKVGPAP